MNESSYIVGTIVTYTCNSGFQFSSEATSRVCLINSTWSMEDIECLLGKDKIIMIFVSDIHIQSSTDNQ